jgi:hypothetical protein
MRVAEFGERLLAAGFSVAAKIPAAAVVGEAADARVTG